MCGGEGRKVGSPPAMSQESRSQLVRSEPAGRLRGGGLSAGLWVRLVRRVGRRDRLIWEKQGICLPLSQIGSPFPHQNCKEILPKARLGWPQLRHSTWLGAINTSFPFPTGIL